ncbi:MAG: 6,7-dimethyl-8-ribityllumazine synthase [Planctomycetales bacterium]|nr:6,7-dimethyl-8-ribityllumazine synthase [Planctomycetales bacterium]
MANQYAGERKAVSGARYGIVVSRYHESITAGLLEGALRTLAEAGVPEDHVDVAWVPGTFEIPLAAWHLATGQEYAAVLCLGAVIRGETTHDQHINRAVSMGISEVGLRSGVPVLFGVLTCDTLEQAIHRAGGSVGNKGVECAAAALEMASLLSQLDASPPHPPGGEWSS